jgi:hypothetical protein
VLDPPAEPDVEELDPEEEPEEGVWPEDVGELRVGAGEPGTAVEELPEPEELVEPVDPDALVEPDRPERDRPPAPPAEGAVPGVAASRYAAVAPPTLACARGPT